MREEFYTLYFDGACLPVNPGGTATYGCVIKDPNGKVIAWDCGIASEEGTNNIAEYFGLIQGLKKALELGIRKIIVKGDSQLAINQMLGVYSVRSPNIIPLYKEACKLASQFEKIKFVWIPRSQNKLADELSKNAFLKKIEARSKERSREIQSEEIHQISENTFKVRSYIVDLANETCTCPYYKKINSYRLLKRDKIRVKCKHIFAVLREVKECTRKSERED